MKHYIVQVMTCRMGNEWEEVYAVTAQTPKGALRACRDAYERICGLAWSNVARTRTFCASATPRRVFESPTVDDFEAAGPEAHDRLMGWLDNPEFDEYTIERNDEADANLYHALTTEERQELWPDISQRERLEALLAAVT